MKNNSHLPQGPAKTESIRKKEQLLHSCEKGPGWPEKGIALFLDTDCCHMCRRFKEVGLNEAGAFFSQSSLYPCSALIKCLTYCLLLSGVCSRLCFAHPKIQGEVSSCVRLEMPCGMQGSGKKSKPLAYRPQS